MKSSTRTHVVKTCASVCMLLMGLFTKAQNGVIFYDDCEASNKPVMVGTNGNVSAGWTSRQGSTSNSSIARSNSYARKGNYSYKHTLSNSTNDGWQYMKAELAWNFLPAGSPLGTVGDRTAFSRTPLGLRWMAASTLIPASNNDHNTITSILFNTKPVEDDWPTPTYLGMEAGRYVFIITKLSPSGAATISKTDVGPVVKGQWEDWVMNRDFSSGANGFVRLYKNGKLVAEYIGPNWKVDGKHSVEPYMQMGLYKWAFGNNHNPKPNVDYVEMYMDEVRFGNQNAKLEDFLLDGNTTPPPPTNQLPTVNLGSNRSITLPTSTITLNGTAADADGSISTYRWSQVSGPNTATIANGSSASASFSNLIQGTYSFRLTVTDNNGGTASSTISVSVVAAPLANVPPVAVAGPNRTITLPTNTTTLAGSGTDADGTVTGYRWRQVNGPNTATIANNTAANTSVSGLVEGIYTFRLIVTDNDGSSHSNEMTVTVNAAPVLNVAPVAVAGPNRTITLPTNTANLAGSGTDSDGTVESFRWRQVNGPSTASFTNNTAASTSVTGLLQGTYTFRLTVTDNEGATHSNDMTVTVNPAPVDNIAPVAVSGPNRNITLPTSTTNLSGSGTDADGTITSYRWRQMNGPNTATITNNAAAATSVSGLIQGTYTFRLTVTDNDGATHSDNMNVTVNPAPNQIPTVDAGSNRTITLPVSRATLSGSANDEDGTIASYRWTQVSGPSTASIENAAQASTTVSNLEAGVYIFRLRVTDNDGAAATDEMTVRVNAAAPVNIAPVANAGTNRTITLPNNRVSLNGSGTDSDGTIASYRWTQVSGPSTALLNPVDAAATTVSNLQEGTYVFRLTVTDNNGATDSDETTVVVRPAPIPNVAPIAHAGSNRTITLPTSSLTLNGTGTDEDGTIASYRWTQVSGPSTATIASDNTASTGISSLQEGQYIFRLTVTDDDGARDADDVIITVNPAPLAAQKKAPVSNAGGKKTVNTKATTLDGSDSYDPDGTIVSYSWSQTSGPNTSSIKAAKAATTEVSNLVIGTYTYNLVVTDNDGLKHTSSLTLVVVPAPVAPIARAGAPITISLPTNKVELDGSASTDADGTITSYRWTQTSGPAASQILTPNASKTAVSNLIAGDYRFQLEVTDNSGLKNTATVTVQVKPNQAPVIVTTEIVDVLLPADTVTLDGSQSYDPDGRIRLFQWKMINGPSNAVLKDNNTSITFVSGLVAGIYTFELLIRDNGNITVKKEVMVRVSGTGGKERMAMKLYPNPVSSNGVVTLRLDDNSSGKGAVYFFSISGVMVMRDEINKNTTHFTKTYNLSNFAAGTYVVRIHFEGMPPITRKFQKQ